MAPGGDVGVELARAGREALGVAGRARRAAADEERAGLEQVAGGWAGSSGRRPMVTASRVAWTQARRACHGASNGAVARAMPLVHSSPSGTPVARTKNPPTMASPVPLSAHQASSLVGRAKRTTRTSVRAAS